MLKDKHLCVGLINQGVGWNNNVTQNIHLINEASGFQCHNTLNSTAKSV